MRKVGRYLFPKFEPGSISEKIYGGLLRGFLFLMLCSLSILFLFFHMINKNSEHYACNYLASTTELLSYQVGRELTLKNPEVAHTLIENFSKLIGQVVPGDILSVRVDDKSSSNSSWSCHLTMGRLDFARKIEFAQTDMGFLVGSIGMFDGRIIFFIFFLLFLLSFLVFSVLGRFLYSVFKTHIVDPLQAIAQSEFSTKDVPLATEMQTIVSMILNSHSRAIKAETQIEKLKSQEELARLASSVSHDIRSPLTALNLVVTHLANIPEEHRLLIRNSVSRIQDIANTLLQRGKSKLQDKGSDSPLGDEFTIEYLPALIENIVTEKRIQFRDRMGVDIRTCTEEAYDSFVRVSSRELMRVASNIINNSVEAFGSDPGWIEIIVKRKGSNVLLTFLDNGRGIPPHIMDDLGEFGLSYGKKSSTSGSGIGLWHAKKTAEECGAKLSIESDQGKGTKVAIEFPLAPIPDWFVREIVITKTAKTELISVDDDLSIHGIWKEVLHRVPGHSEYVTHIAFTSGFEFIAYVNQNPNHSNRIFLIDYEFLNQEFTGLDLIRDLKIFRNVFLVTSRYDEPRVQEQCLALGIKLIPKAMAVFIPIVFDAERYDLCLIDDDTELIHPTWKLLAEARGLRIRLFSSAREFFACSSEIDFLTPVYVDVSLGSGEDGISVAQKIHSLGYHEVNLATGHPVGSIAVPPFIHRVTGKDFPI